MVLLNLLPDDMQISLLGYQTSGAVTGNYRNSVSYLAVAFQSRSDIASPSADDMPAVLSTDEVLDDRSMQLLHDLAVQAVQVSTKGDSASHVRLDQMMQDIPDNLKYPSATFITLTRDDQLRGCIGSIAADAPLHESVVKNAINAALYDYRFSPVEVAEVPLLTLEVSVLTAPKPIASWHEFEVGRHGIILEKNGQKAVYLPEVAPQQGWNREQTLSHLSQKAGLGPDGWRQGAQFKVFTTQKYTRPIRSQNK
jgi:AmmeMemoRadiSam system protein A